MTKNILKDQRGSGSGITLKSLAVILIMLMLVAVIIDSLYVAVAYFYIKTQMDMSNRAVYAEVDILKLADRQFYIDENKGEKRFYSYLKKNLNLDNSLEPINPGFNIVGPIKIIDFEIYNEEDLPSVTPVGTYVDMISVHSRIEVKIRPIFYGFFDDVTIRPYIDTDLPDKLLKTFYAFN